MTVLTPTVRQASRTSLFWVGALVFVILAAIGSLLLVGAATETVALSPTSAAPDGAMGVAEVLRQQGVDVIVTESLSDTAAALRSSDQATVVMHDPDDLLNDDQRQRILGLSGHLIVLNPSFDALATLAPGVNAAGTPDDDALVAGCDLPAATQAGEVSPGGTAYRVPSPSGAELCLVSDGSDADDAHSLVELDVDGTRVSVVGATAALTNGEVLEYGNAAFALNLLGETDTLVWYLPSFADVAGAGDPAALTPRWLTPVIVLLVITAIAAAFWRGRRFGPLIIENLPVVVRSSETMEGRARLYQKASARLRALDTLRIGTVSRLAKQCGLSSSASVEEVVLGVSAVTGTEARGIRDLLVGEHPANDAELVRLSDGLLELGAAVTKAVRG